MSNLNFPLILYSETYTNTFFLPARNSLSKETGPRKSENQPNTFNMDYRYVSDFTLVIDSTSNEE